MGHETHDTIKGLAGWVRFRVSRQSADPDGILSAIRAKGACDLIAAAVLERLCRGLRTDGFPFDHPATGFGGAYATTLCRLQDLYLTVFLFRLKRGDDADEEYEIQAAAARTRAGRRWIFSRRIIVSASQGELTTWERLRGSLKEALNEHVSASDLKWDWRGGSLSTA